MRVSGPIGPISGDISHFSPGCATVSDAGDPIPVLVLAGLNAFSEEVAFRAGPLAIIRDVIGDRQAMFLVATLFAVPHYFGVPYGVVGVGMAWVFAWWVTKSMIETRGILWAWFIHLLQDVVIFSFLLAGSVA